MNDPGVKENGTSWTPCPTDSFTSGSNNSTTCRPGTGTVFFVSSFCGWCTTSLSHAQTDGRRRSVGSFRPGPFLSSLPNPRGLREDFSCRKQGSVPTQPQPTLFHIVGREVGRWETSRTSVPAPGTTYSSPLFRWCRTHVHDGTGESPYHVRLGG